MIRQNRRMQSRPEWNNNFNSDFVPGVRPESVSDDEDTKAFKEEFRRQQQEKQRRFRTLKNNGKIQPHKPRVKKDNNKEFIEAAVQHQQDQGQLKKPVQDINKVFGIATSFMVGEKDPKKVNNSGEKFVLLEDMTLEELQNALTLHPNSAKRKEVNKAVQTLNLNFGEVQSNIMIQKVVLDTINGPPGWKRIKFTETGKIVYWDMKTHELDGTHEIQDKELLMQQLKEKYEQLKKEKIMPQDPIEIIPRPKEKKK